MAIQIPGSSQSPRSEVDSSGGTLRSTGPILARRGSERLLLSPQGLTASVAGASSWYEINRRTSRSCGCQSPTLGRSPNPVRSAGGSGKMRRSNGRSQNANPASPRAASTRPARDPRHGAGGLPWRMNLVGTPSASSTGRTRNALRGQTSHHHAAIQGSVVTNAYRARASGGAWRPLSDGGSSQDGGSTTAGTRRAAVDLGPGRRLWSASGTVDLGSGALGRSRFFRTPPSGSTLPAPRSGRATEKDGLVLAPIPSSRHRLVKTVTKLRVPLVDDAEGRSCTLHTAGLHASVRHADAPCGLPLILSSIGQLS